MPRTRHVALIMNVAKPYDRGVIGGIAEYVRSVGRWSLYVEDDPLTKMPNPRKWRGDGIIANLDDPRVVAAVRDLKIPVVGVGGGGVVGGEDEPAVPYVATDDQRIGVMAADHLLDRGLRNFAYCGAPRTPANPWAAMRGKAFSDRVGELGCKCAMFVGRHRTPQQWESLQQALTKWLGSLPHPVGLMACNDARARHVLEACRRISARVPEDVAVVGVDNDEMLCDLSIPPLTSVIQGTSRIGYHAAELLEAMMSGRPPRTTRLVIEPAGIATRRSTDVLAVTDNLVLRAIQYIHDHLADRAQVDLIAEHVGVSRSTLDMRFRKALGRSAHEQIRHAQLELAKQLLTQTTAPLAQVAQRAGFNNEQYLCAVFRKETGLTPASYRNGER